MLFTTSVFISQLFNIISRIRNVCNELARAPQDILKFQEKQQHLLDTVWATTISWLGPNYIKNIIYIGVKYQKEMTEILRVPWMKKAWNF